MYDLDDETKLIQNTVRQFVTDVVMPTAADIDIKDEFPREIYRSLGELGLLSMTLSEPYGGANASTFAWSVVQEELARGSAAVADAHMVNKLMCDVLLSNANEEDREHFVPKMGRGEVICAIAQTEADTGSDVAAIKTAARKVDGGYLLKGAKQFITFAGICDIAIVVATIDRNLGRKGIGLFLAEATSEGFHRGAKNKLMGTRGLETGELVFEDCFVPDHRMIAPPGEGMKRSLSSLNSGRIGMAAQSIGIAQAAFELSLRFAKDRTAFGGPIANLQAIQFMLADMSVSIEAGRLMTRRAAHARDANRPLIREVAEAKLFASELAAKVVDDALQIHGAHGFSQEATIERLYRDARVYRIWEGTSQIQRIVIARQLLAA
ncbi:acyl-CoA dehydrogenase family protein [Aminobacter sp. MDW-2]|uniref:acyl-CoA dehydrogenase family protein n=1 Tax=Aminobacter sp. MDW-2 TaxID=2666139 RepID=UPI0012B11966|nr:acyl-CoA dehydrogenase family protein [Aminobacter sp. MDW-2]MRX37586.1 acyl-CoA dehydrogenase [Aminobacter sp. MDW-2]QNH37894.1 acyl-CoA dehydrogenase family protein [Aminobacter sp. MDW-2]